MADISTELANIMSAIYGEEVRGSIRDAIEKMNTQLNAAISGTLNGLGFRGNYNGSLDGLYTENDRGIWLLRPNGSFTDYPDGYSKSRCGILFVYSNDYSDNSYCRQELRYYSVNNDSESSKVWTRTYFTEGVGFSAFSEWTLDTPLSFKGNYSNGASINALNSEDDRGIYKLLGSYTYSGLPDDYDQSIAGYLIVYAMGSNTIQELRYFSGSGGNENIIWRRNYSGSWGTWEKNIDPSLTKEGIAADAKAVGEALNNVNLKALVSKNVYIPSGDRKNLNDFYTQGIYTMLSPQNAINWPFDSTMGIFVVINASANIETFSAYQVVQLAFCDGKFAYRSSIINNNAVQYCDWTIYSIDPTLTIAGAAADAKAVGDAINNLNVPTIDTTLSVEGAAADAKAVGDNTVSANGFAVSTDPQHPVKDLNDYKKPGIHYVGIESVTNWAFDDNYKGVLVVFNPMTAGQSISKGIVQLAFSNGEFAYRTLEGFGTGGEDIWSDWIKNDNGRLLDIIESIADVNSVQNEIEASENQNYYLEKVTGSNCRVKSSTGTELVLYSVAVTAKKNYRVTASNVSSIDNAILAFATRALADNVSCSMLIDNTGGPTIDYSYSPTQDGYLFLSKGTNSSMTYHIYEIDEETTLKTDKTLSIENMPADAKMVGDIKNALNYIDLLNYTTIQNMFIDYRNGNSVSFSDDTFYATDWISVCPGQKLYVNHYRNPSFTADLAGMAFYTKGKAFISGIQYTKPYDAIETIVPENAAFVRCTWFSNVEENLLILQSNYSAQDISLIGKNTIISSEAEPPFDDANTIPVGTIVTYLQGCFPINVPPYGSSSAGACTIITLNYNKRFFGGKVQIFSDRYRFCVRMADNESSYGAWSSLTNSIGYPINSASSFVAPFNDANTIPAGTTICYIGNNYKPANYPVGTHDISICRTYNYAQHAFGGKLQIVADDSNMWFRLATTESSYQSWVLLTNSKNAIHSESAFSLFENVGVIGDSYASGALTLESYSGSDHYSISWPQIVARKNGINVVNFSKGGLTTRSWLTNEKGLPFLQSESAKDLYICTLGINDNASLRDNYIGSVSDIAIEADTFYGNYGKIINAIKTKAPNAKIVLSTMAPSAPGLYVAEYNEAIVAIANYFSIPCMIQGDDPYFVSDQYINNIRYNHPMAGGYMHMANAFDRMLCKVIDENVNYFADYGITLEGDPYINWKPIVTDDGNGNITIEA